MRSEDALVLCGLLVGINFIDIELSLQVSDIGLHLIAG